MSTLAEKVLALLEKEGGNKTHFARLANIHPSTLNEILNGRDPGFSKILAISKALKVPLSYFSDDEPIEPEKALTPSEKKAAEFAVQVLRLGVEEASRRLSREEPSSPEQPVVRTYPVTRSKTIPVRRLPTSKDEK